MMSEEEAIGKTKQIYQDIKETLGVDFVPNMYKVMASKPSYLETKWNKIKAVMKGPGKLDRLTKEIIAVAVSAVMGVNIESRFALLPCRSWDWMMKIFSN